MVFGHLDSVILIFLLIRVNPLARKVFPNLLQIGEHHLIKLIRISKFFKNNTTEIFDGSIVGSNSFNPAKEEHALDDDDD